MVDVVSAFLAHFLFAIKFAVLAADTRIFTSGKGVIHPHAGWVCEGSPGAQQCGVLSVGFDCEILRRFYEKVCNVIASGVKVDPAHDRVCGGGYGGVCVIFNVARVLEEIFNDVHRLILCHWA